MSPANGAAPLAAIDPAELRAFLEAQRARVFGALGIVELVQEDVVDDPDHGDRCFGALGAAREQLQATHDELYDWIAAHMGEQSGGAP